MQPPGPSLGKKRHHSTNPGLAALGAWGRRRSRSCHTASMPRGFQPWRSVRATKTRPSTWSETDSAGDLSQCFKVENLAAGDGLPAASGLTHSRQSRVGQSDDAFGALVMSRGEHRFVLTIECAHSSSGAGLVLGVAAAPDPSQPSYVRPKWGVRPWDGRCVRVPAPGPSATDANAVILAESHPRVGLYTERAVAKRVEVIVDMERRAIAFSVDGASAVDAGVLPDELPSALVPWAQLFFKGDTVALSHHRERPPRRASPRSPPPPVMVTRGPQWDERVFEAGPWTP